MCQCMQPFLDEMRRGTLVGRLTHLCASRKYGGAVWETPLASGARTADMMRHPGLPLCLVAFAGGGREVGVDERAHISPCNMDAW